MKKNVLKTKRMAKKEEDQENKRFIQKPKKANGFKENPSKPKKPDKDTDTDKDKDKDKDSSNIYNADVAKIDKLMIECLNTTNTNSIYECIGYLDNLNIDVIEYVLKKTSRIAHPNWGYAMSILDDYVRKKIDTVEKAKADDLNYRNNKNILAEEEFLNEQD